MIQSLKYVLLASTLTLGSVAMAQVPAEISGVYVGTVTAKVSNTASGLPYTVKTDATLLLDTSGSYYFSAQGLHNQSGTMIGNTSNAAAALSDSTMKSVLILHFKNGKPAGTLSLYYSGEPGYAEMMECTLKLKKAVVK